MKLSFLALFYILFCASACSSQKKSSGNNVKQGIAGYVKEATGNQMPSPDREPSTPKGLKTTVFIYEITNIKQVRRIGTSPFYQSLYSKFIKSVETDSKGYFITDMPTGNYSLFVKVDGNYYANSFDSNNNISLVSVQPNHLSEVNITVSSRATY